MHLFEAYRQKKAREAYHAQICLGWTAKARGCLTPGMVALAIAYFALLLALVF